MVEQARGNPKKGEERDGEALSVRGAACFLGITEKAVRQRISRGQLPFRRLGGSIILLRRELNAYLVGLPGVPLAEAIRNVEATRT